MGRGTVRGEPDRSRSRAGDQTASRATIRLQRPLLCRCWRGPDCDCGKGDAGRRRGRAPAVPLLEAHASQLGRMPQRVAADTKYGTRTNYRYCFDRGIAPSIRMAKLHKKEKGYSTDAFRYDPLRDLYRCPIGQPLLRRVEANSSDAVIYRADPASCRVCPVRKHCTACPQGRGILRLRGQEYRDRAKAAYLATAQARRDLRRRQVSIEGVFADAKTYRGLIRACGFGLASMPTKRCWWPASRSSRNWSRLTDQRAWPFPWPSALAPRGRSSPRLSSTSSCPPDRSSNPFGNRPSVDCSS